MDAVAFFLILDFSYGIDGQLSCKSRECAW